MGALAYAALIAARHKVDATMIQNCWQKAGILPESIWTSLPTTQPTLPILSLIHPTDAMDNPAAHAEMLVKNALDDLEATGALQPSNWMDIAGLLNPEIETADAFHVIDEDIFESVMDAKRLQEGTAGEDEDDTNEFAPGPTHREALQAALTLRKYLGTINEPFAHKMEVELGSFGQQTRAVEMQGMSNTKITDYFCCK